MITDTIIRALMYYPLMLINAIPALDVSMSNEYIDIFKSYMSYVAYFIPVAGLIPIILLNFAIANFRIIWALILRVKSLIPTMGD